jgi:hypothetical protein
MRYNKQAVTNYSIVARFSCGGCKLDIAIIIMATLGISLIGGGGVLLKNSEQSGIKGFGVAAIAAGFLFLSLILYITPF